MSIKSRVAVPRDASTERDCNGEQRMFRAVRLRWLPMFGLGIVSLGILGSCKSESAYERDSRARGKGSQEAWLDATGGRYNGDLPRE